MLCDVKCELEVSVVLHTRFLKRSINWCSKPAVKTSLISSDNFCDIQKEKLNVIILILFVAKTFWSIFKNSFQHFSDS